MLGCAAFFAGGLDFPGMFGERCFVRAQGSAHLLQKLIGLFDLILLHPHLFTGGRNIGKMPADE